MDHIKHQPATQLLNELHQLVDTHLQRAISVYQNLSQHQLDQPAVNGGWSITQCLDHLNSYGRYYLPRILKAVTEKPTDAVAIVSRGWLGDYFIKMMDPTIKPAKYKALKGHLPQTNLDAHSVVAEFIRQQESLIKLLSMAAKANLNQIYIPTSISPFIKLRLGDTLSFVIIHNERHIQQADRNLA